MTARREAEGGLVLVEGMSGTGKTTHCRDICQRTGSIMVPELPEFLRYSWTRLGAPDTWLDNLRLMLTVGIERQSFADRLAERGFQVVLDRSILSPLAIVAGLVSSRSHIALDALRLCESKASQVSFDRCTLSILNPPEDVWKERLRQHEKAKNWPWTDHGFQRAGQRLFLSLGIDKVSTHAGPTTRNIVNTRGDLNGFYTRGLQYLRELM
jgi:hypothetical protein